MVPPSGRCHGAGGQSPQSLSLPDSGDEFSLYLAGVLEASRGNPQLAAARLRASHAARADAAPRFWTQFTLAHCSAWVSLPLVGMATKSVLGDDLLAGAGADWKGYARMVGERPSAQKVAADRKADPLPRKA